MSIKYVPQYVVQDKLITFLETSAEIDWPRRIPEHSPEK